MTPYLTYEEYSDMGGVLDLTAFNRIIYQVHGIIDNATHNRVKNMKEISPKIKYLCFNLLEYLEKSGSNQVTSKSQSAGGVSESVSYATKNTDVSIDIENIIRDYLQSETDDNGTPLLYRGAMY
jgi:hypothetical protein